MGAKITSNKKPEFIIKSGIKILNQEEDENSKKDKSKIMNKVIKLQRLRRRS